MTERKKKTLTIVGTVVLAVAVAYTFRLIGNGNYYFVLFPYLRSFIYIGLFIAWGISIRRRIVQKQVAQYLTGISVLLILWFTFRSAKYFIFWQPTAIRYLWYLYYLPMLFIPILALLVALSLGKPDDYRLPKAACALWIISGALLLLVLTNDLHQLVFTFPEDAEVWSDKSNGYGIGSFFVIGWQIFCMISALVVMIIKCRLKNGRRQLWTVIPMVVSLVYLGLNYMDVQWFKLFFGDITAFQSLMYMLCFEGCITCGFIHSNSRHFDLFSSSIGTSAVITELVRAFTESLQTLKLLNVRSTFFADSELSMLPGKSAAAIFDFYEQVIESDLENISGIQVSLSDVEGLRLSINICCKTDLSSLACKGNVRYETDGDEGYQHLVFLLEGGVAV